MLLIPREYLLFIRYSFLFLLLPLLLDVFDPFVKAAFNGYVSCVRRLVQLGAKVDMRDEAGETVLHKAAFSGHVECCKAFLDQGVSVNTKYGLSPSPLSPAN